MVDRDRVELLGVWAVQSCTPYSCCQDDSVACFPLIRTPRFYSESHSHTLHCIGPIPMCATEGNPFFDTPHSLLVSVSHRSLGRGRQLDHLMSIQLHTVRFFLSSFPHSSLPHTICVMGGKFIGRCSYKSMTLFSIKCCYYFCACNWM